MRHLREVGLHTESERGASRRFTQLYACVQSSADANDSLRPLVWVPAGCAGMLLCGVYPYVVMQACSYPVCVWCGSTAQHSTCATCDVACRVAHGAAGARPCAASDLLQLRPRARRDTSLVHSLGLGGEPHMRALHATAYDEGSHHHLMPMAPPSEVRA